MFGFGERIQWRWNTKVRGGSEVYVVLSLVPRYTRGSVVPGRAATGQADPRGLLFVSSLGYLSSRDSFFAVFSPPMETLTTPLPLYLNTG